MSLSNYLYNNANLQKSRKILTIRRLFISFLKVLKAVIILTWPTQAGFKGKLLMTTDQLKNLKGRLSALRDYLKIDERLQKIEEQQQLSLDPNFWNDSKRAEVILKDLKLNKQWVDSFKTFSDKIDDLEVMHEFWREGEVEEEELDSQYAKTVDFIDDVEFKSTLNRDEDALGCILEINAGAGGTESCDWAEMLARMYRMWGERMNFKVSLLNEVIGEVAGIKSAQLEITGDYAYGYLKGENGVHRLVRISPFNSQGKRMTSFASVFVHPSVDDSVEIDINPADLEWDRFRASGAGGQHVNKTESAVRIRHIPSGVVVECQQERSQHLNREKAMQMLRSRLYQLELERQLEERDKVEATKMKNEWGSQIRSYVLDDRWVKDLRSGYKVTNPDKVLDGDLDGFIKAYLMMNKKENG